MSDEATRASRRGRALVALAGAALVVLTPMRVTWTSEWAGLVGPLAMWLLLVALVRVTVRPIER